MAYNPTPRSSRLRYVGVHERTDGIDVYWRMEHNFGPAGWIANGPVIKGFVPKAQLVNAVWENILMGASESDVAAEQAEMERAAQDPLF